MRTDVSAYGTQDIRRDVAVRLYPDATFAQLIQGSASGALDLGPYVRACTQGAGEASARLAVDDALLAVQPRPGHLLQIEADGRVLFNGVIDTVNDWREERGARTLSLTARTRDAVGPWRSRRIATSVYPLGTQLDRIAHDILAAFGVTGVEDAIPVCGFWVPHTNAQMADMTPWDMLETVLLPAGLAPFVDALGRFRAHSRSVARAADLALAMPRVVAIRGGKSRPQVNAVRLAWLDKNLAKSAQQDQALGTVTIPAGFFKLEQAHDVWFSDDKRQRAEGTYMVVQQSVNSGLLPVGSERYDPIDEYHGRVTVRTDAWVPGLAGASLAALYATAGTPDGVITDPVSGVGETVPVGRYTQAAAEIAILLVMMSLGVGVYEIRGTPFDYIHARNKTEAYNANAPAWMEAVREIENDFIADEAHAQEVAVRELLYANAEASTWGVTIIDDPRIERGDILELPDASRLFVTDYSRDLARGAAALLDVEGFRV